MARPLFSIFTRRPSHRARPRQTRLLVEVLEERRVLSSLTWSAGIALPVARSGDAAILASNQSVLVLGGNTTTVNDLALNGSAWSGVDSLPQALVSPGVGSLGGSKLLVYGGTGGTGAVNSALQYDPTNPSNIQNVAAMSTPRSLLAFATDGSNRAYAIGGIDASGNRLATVERFDPATGSWSLVAPLPKALARSGAAAVYDGAGHIFVFGGATNSSSRTTTVLEYMVATNAWSTLTVSMPTATTEAAAVLGPDGMIYVIGGKGSEGAQSTVQAYNPTTNAWTKAASLPNAVSDEAAVVDGENRIEVIGGKNSNGSAVSSVSVTQSLANFAPQITTAATALPTATAGAAYAATVAAIGLPAPTFTVKSGPTGLTINATTGVISWAPTAGQIGTQTVTVQAQNVAGAVQQTFTIAVTPDTTPPSTPVLSVAAITSTSSITLNWTAATDNVGVAGYRLYQYTPAYVSGHSGRGGGGTYHPATYSLLVDGISPTTTSHTFTGLSPLTTYNYAVAAYDAAGNQSSYSTAGGTTLQSPSITYYVGSYVNPTLSVIANHQLYFTVYAGGSPTPTLSLVSAPAGVVFTPGTITWTPTASEVGGNDIIMQATNSVGTCTLDIPVTVTADLPLPSLTVNGGLAYTMGNYTTVNPNAYQVALNPGFDITYGTYPQYAFAGTPFTFQLTGVSKTNPTTYAIVPGSAPASMTIDPSTGIGTWIPGASDASAATSVTVSASNSAGTTSLTFAFPTYFSTGPTNVAVGFYTSTSGSAPATWTPVVTWTPPANPLSPVTDYKVTVNDLNKNTSTVYDVGIAATTYTLPPGLPDQNSISVTAYAANGGPSQVSTNVASLYLLALGSVDWNFSTPNVIAGQPLTVQFQNGGTPYGIAVGPASATINPTTGLLSWTPTLADVGTANIVVSSGNINGWGAVYATLNFPVYFTDAPAALSASSTTDPVTNAITSLTASWTAPTTNTSSIVSYQIAALPAGSAPGTLPTIFLVSSSSLSADLLSMGIMDGSIQVTAVDSAGDLGVSSAWIAV